MITKSRILAIGLMILVAAVLVIYLGTIFISSPKLQWGIPAYAIQARDEAGNYQEVKIFTGRLLAVCGICTIVGFISGFIWHRKK